MAQQIRVLVLRDENMFVAQCLEVDVAAQGKTSEEAMSRLRAVFHAELEALDEDGKDISSMSPAPECFHALYAADVVDRTELVA